MDSYGSHAHSCYRDGDAPTVSCVSVPTRLCPSPRPQVPSDRALSGLVRAYVQAGQARAGVMRCRRRFRRWGAGVAGWNALLSACEEASLFDVAVDVYQEMRSGELG